MRPAHEERPGAKVAALKKSVIADSMDPRFGSSK